MSDMSHKEQAGGAPAAPSIPARDEVTPAVSRRSSDANFEDYDGDSDDDEVGHDLYGNEIHGEDEPSVAPATVNTGNSTSGSLPASIPFSRRNAVLQRGPIGRGRGLSGRGAPIPRHQFLSDDEEDEEEVDHFRPGSGRTLGSFDPSTVQTGPTQAEIQQAGFEAQERGARDREARDRRALLAEATRNRLARISGSTPSSGSSMTGNMGQASSSTTSTSTYTTAAPSPSTPTGTSPATTNPAPSTTTPELSTTAPNPLAALFPERFSRIAQQQRDHETVERVRENQRRATKEAQLTPQEKAEKKMKEQGLAELKKKQAQDKIDKARIQKKLEDDKKHRAERFQREKENRHREQAARERREREKKEAHEKVKREIEEEERARREMEEEERRRQG